MINVSNKTFLSPLRLCLMSYATFDMIRLLIPGLLKHTFSTVQVMQFRIICGLLTGRDVEGELRALFYCDITASE